MAKQKAIVIKVGKEYGEKDGRFVKVIPNKREDKPYEYWVLFFKSMDKMQEKGGADRVIGIKRYEKNGREWLSGFLFPDKEGEYGYWVELVKNDIKVSKDDSYEWEVILRKDKKPFKKREVVEESEDEELPF